MILGGILPIPAYAIYHLVVHAEGSFVEVSLKLCMQFESCPASKANTKLPKNIMLIKFGFGR